MKYLLIIACLLASCSSQLPSDGKPDEDLTVLPVGGKSPQERLIPTTTIDVFPEAVSKETSPSFAFHADRETATHECSLDGAPFAPCESGVIYERLADGAHRFRVRSIGILGEVEEQPVSYTWTIDTLPPTVFLLKAFPNISNGNEVTLDLACNEPPCGYLCDIGIGYRPCDRFLDLSKVDEGGRTITIKALDLAGNESAAMRVVTFIDRTAPSATISTSNVSTTTTNQTHPQIAVDAIDEGGIAAMRFRVDSGKWGAWLPFARISNTISLAESGDGVKSIEIQLRDLVGNLSQPAGLTLRYDTTPPILHSATIDGQEGFEITTARSSVVMGFDVPDATDLRIALGEQDITAQPWQIFTSEFTLSDLGTTGRLLVFVQFRDEIDNHSEVYEFAIVHPRFRSATTSFCIADCTSTTNIQEVILTLNASEAAWMRIAEDIPIAEATWVTYSAAAELTLSDLDGEHEISVQFKAADGELSPELTQTILLDRIPPLRPRISTADNTAVIYSSPLVITPFAIGASEYRCVEEGNPLPISWTTYPQPTTLPLTPTIGSKTILAEFRDLAGNISTASLFLDVPYLFFPACPAEIGAVQSLVQHKGNLYISNDAAELFRLQPDALECQPIDRGLVDDPIAHLVSSDEKLLIVTSDLIRRYDEESQSLIEQEHLPDDFGPSTGVFSISGNLWLASDNGVLMQSQEQWQRFSTADRLASDLVTSVASSSLGSDRRFVWIATFGGGLAVFDQQTEEWDYRTDQDGLLSNQVIITVDGPSDDIWIGTTVGAQNLSSEGFGPAILPDFEIQAIEPFSSAVPTDISDDLVWLCGNDGDELTLVSSDRGELHHYDSGTGLPAGEDCRVLVVISPSRLWIGTDRGLFGLLLPEGKYPARR